MILSYWGEYVPPTFGSTFGHKELQGIFLCVLSSIKKQFLLFFSSG